MTVPFYLLGNDCCSGLLSLTWAPPCLLLSRRSQEQGPCFSQTNTPTACFLLLLEAELSKAFRKTWSYLQKAWEQATCFPRAFWLAIHWCGWRPPPSSQQFPVKVKRPMLKGKKKNYLQIQSNLKILFGIISYSTNQLPIIIWTILRKINLELDTESIWYLVFFLLHFTPPLPIPRLVMNSGHCI